MKFHTVFAEWYFVVNVVFDLDIGAEEVGDPR